AADRAGSAVAVGAAFLVALDPAGHPRWSIQRLGLRDVAPTLLPEAVLAATDDGVLAADRATGRLRWVTGLGDRASTAVVAGDMAVITLWEGALVGVRLADGGVAWRVPLPGLAIGPPAGHAGLIVATWEEAH